MKRKTRGRRAAIKAARLSKFYAHRVGAVLFNGPRLISLGYNVHKSHPENTCFTRHAEFNSLKRTKTRTNNLVMYVARLTRTDKISLARPCPACQIKIREAGIREVYYTTHSGELEKLTFDAELVGSNV